MKYSLTVLCVLNYLQWFCEASKILAIIPAPSKSHYAPFEPLFKELAAKGHELRVLSHFPQKEKIPNFTDIDISTSFPKVLGGMPLPVAGSMTILGAAIFLWQFASPGICEAVLSHPEVKQLLESDEKFDLLLTEEFITDCFLGFVHRFKVPYVGLSSCVATPWIPKILANPDNPSYIPQLLSHYSDRMNYLQRFINTFYLSVLKIGYKICSDTLGHGMAKNYFGPDLPSYNDLRSKVGLLLINSHHSFNAPQALAPGVKEVGGIHIPRSGPAQLEKDLDDYLNSATEGVVYVSMGSQLNASTFPAENMAIFLKAFAELDQRVLWKCNEPEMPELPRNVKCVDWVPQLSVLCKVSLFPNIPNNAVDQKKK